MMFMTWKTQNCLNINQPSNLLTDFIKSNQIFSRVFLVETKKLIKNLYGNSNAQIANI